ncbi:MAG: hypothetical protein RLZZ127_2235 [Planctomycetota bacterium]
MTPRAFLADLRQEVLHHPAVGHSLIGRMTMDPRCRQDFRIFSGQHYPLVGTFTRYLELLLLNAPSSRDKLWLAKVLVDEYGERSDGRDHADHYRDFMRAAGWPEGAWDDEPLHPAVTGFIEEHLRLCAHGHFLEGLGAVGPGHEWAIPTMFQGFIGGLRQAGFAEAEILYFTMHTEQDQDHGAWLEEALMTLAVGDEAQARIAAGCRASLAARERLWWGVADRINADRMATLLPGIGGGTSTAGWETLRGFRARIRGLPAPAAA